MQEMMVAGGGGQVFPWSGPGSKKLMYGTRDLGYFGTLTSSELFSDATLTTLTGVTTGTIGSGGAGQLWYKFILRGRVIYLAKYPTRISVAWSDLYKAGVVHGVKGYGDSPVPVAGGVDQFKLLTKSETINSKRKVWPLKVALLSGANDGVFPSGSVWDSDQSEWDLLWTKFFTDKWDPSANWSTMNFGSSYWHFVKERSADGAYAAVRGSSAITTKSRVLVDNTTAAFAWRPKIELITDPNIALEIQTPFFVPVGGMGIPLATIDSTEQNPVQAVINVTARNSAMLVPMAGLQTLDPAVYLKPSTGGEVLAPTLTTEAELVQLANVVRANPSRMPAYRADTGHEEVFAVVPDAQILITALVGTEDANLQSPAKVLAITNAQIGSIAYTYRSYEPQVYQSTPVKIAFDSPAFTIEPDA